MHMKASRNNIECLHKVEEVLTRLLLDLIKTSRAVLSSRDISGTTDIARESALLQEKNESFTTTNNSSDANNINVPADPFKNLSGESRPDTVDAHDLVSKVIPINKYSQMVMEKLQTDEEFAEQSEDIQENLVVTGKRPTILVVEDDQDISRLWRKYLESMGYRICLASSGTSAFELLTSEPDAFDVVVTDLHMPGISGSILAEKIQDLNADLPVILCTGNAEEISSSPNENMGIYCTLQKPFNLSDLNHAVKNALVGTLL